MNRSLLAIVGVAVIVITVAVGYVGGIGAIGGDPLTIEGSEPTEIEASDEAVVSGSSTLETGTELSVRLRSTDNAGPSFLQSTTTTVEDGSFAAAFDLSDVITERNVTITVTGGNHSTEAPARLVAPEGGFESADAGEAPDVTFDEPVTLPAIENATLSGSTTAAPGTELGVRIRSTDGETAFLKSRTATVSENGSFESTFDLSDLYAEHEIAVNVQGDDWRADTDGRVTAPPGGFPDVEAVEAAFDGDSPLVFESGGTETITGSTSLPEGTGISIHLQSTDDEGRWLINTTETTAGSDGDFTAEIDVPTVESERDVGLELIVYRETVAEAEGRIDPA